MSVDKLQERIRKMKNPSVIDLWVQPEQIPAHILQEEGSFVRAYGRFCGELLCGLKGIVPAVRFSFHTFALLGQEGLAQLAKLLRYAADLGFYVLLDGPEALSAQAAAANARQLLGNDTDLYFDGLILPSYIGSDGLRPYASLIGEKGKALFTVLRTSNRTAPELQDLLTGSRLVHAAAADIVNRLGEAMVGKSGYSQIAAMAAAASPESLRNLRSKYKYLFLLLDGYDYPNANAKNCSLAFDRLGHGAAACAGSSITAAWQAEGSDGRDYVECAIRGAQRMKKNLTRYVSVL